VCRGRCKARAGPTGVSVAQVRREIELRRHTDADGDVLTAEGVAAALAIGAQLRGSFELVVSSGAQRATQTLACLLAALGQPVPGGVIVEPGLRSPREERWRAAYQQAGSGELGALRTADPELVSQDSAALGAALGRVLERLGAGERALVVGTARPTRRPCSASPARRSRRWPRGPASWWWPTATASGSSPWTPDVRPGAIDQHPTRGSICCRGTGTTVSTDARSGPHWSRSSHDGGSCRRPDQTTGPIGVWRRRDPHDLGPRCSAHRTEFLNPTGNWRDGLLMDLLADELTPPPDGRWRRAAHARGDIDDRESLGNSGHVSVARGR
jgi:hypothetical protein